MLINLRRAELRNNEVFVVLFSLLLEPLKVTSLPLLPEKERKIVDPSKRKKIACPLRARAKQSFVPKSLVLKGLVDS